MKKIILLNVKETPELIKEIKRLFGNSTYCLKYVEKECLSTNDIKQLLSECDHLISLPLNPTYSFWIREHAELFNNFFTLHEDYGYIMLRDAKNIPVDVF